MRINIKGLVVSPVCLGCSRLTPEALAAFCDAGGNFLDTAPVYQGGHGEKIIGDFPPAGLVVGTKVGLSQEHFGLSPATIRASLEASLKRLKRDCVDVLWVHAWDRLADPDETFRTLDDLRAKGMAKKLGVCNTPAWVIAASKGLFDFVQVHYSVCEPTAELELIPVAKYADMKVFCYSPFVKGNLTGNFSRYIDSESRRAAQDLRELGDPFDLSLRWMIGKGYVPVVRTSGRHAADNLAAADRPLDEATAVRIEEIKAMRKPDIHPHDFLESETVKFLAQKSKTYTTVFGTGG